LTPGDKFGRERYSEREGKTGECHLGEGSKWKGKTGKWKCGNEDERKEKEERKRDREDKKETMSEEILKGKGMGKLMITREEGIKAMGKRVLKDRRENKKEWLHCKKGRIKG
jgi:hypothetical protein